MGSAGIGALSTYIQNTISNDLCEDSSVLKSALISGAFGGLGFAGGSAYQSIIRTRLLKQATIAHLILANQVAFDESAPAIGSGIGNIIGNIVSNSGVLLTQ